MAAPTLEGADMQLKAPVEQAWYPYMYGSIDMEVRQWRWHHFHGEVSVVHGWTENNNTSATYNHETQRI